MGDVKLVSSDGETFEVERGVATISGLVADVLEDVSDEESTIPIPKVESPILAKVIEYCRYHYYLQSNPQSDEDVEKWDKDFVKVDKPTLFHLILAADYLDIEALLYLACRTVRDMIRGRNAEQICAEFGIVHDFTPERVATWKWWYPTTTLGVESLFLQFQVENLRLRTGSKKPAC